MSLIFKRLSLAKARVEMLTDLHARCLEVAELRERVREAQLSADLNVTRAERPGSVVSGRRPLPVLGPRSIEIQQTARLLISPFARGRGAPQRSAHRCRRRDR